ncbi:Ger(x)C family spore germination protein [Paenibacillus sediminis]|uniref:Spore germination protein KC n=1 Tax=Paenibacillus sediminis TaxID=664909 RepID=A0ABS4H2J0_9BACL|nr:spore germination protein KC [Paenibacillus sediminis]
MGIVRLLNLFSICIMCAVMLTGCWDRIEVNDVAFVLGTAVDKEGSEIRTTVQIALPGQLGGAGSQGGGGGTSGSKPWYLESKPGLSIRDSNENEQFSLSRKENYSHRRILLFGEDLAKDGIGKYLDVLARIPQNRLSSFVLVTRGPASKVISTNVATEKFPAEMIREIMKQSMKKPRTIKHLANALLTEGLDPVLPVVTPDKSAPGNDGPPEDTIRLDGIAVFNHDKCTGFLTGKMAQAVVIAMNQAKDPEIVVPMPGDNGYLFVRLHTTDVSLRPSIKGDSVSVLIKVAADSTILENESNYALTSPESIAKLERMIEDDINSEITEAFRKLQKYHSDALGVGKTIHDVKPKEWDKLKNRWNTIYPSIDVAVQTRVVVENTGAVLKPFARKDGQLKYD